MRGSLTSGLVAGLVGLGAVVGVVVIPRVHDRVPRVVALVGACTVGTTLSTLVFVAVPSPPLKMTMLGSALFFTIGVTPLVWSIIMGRTSGRAAAGLLAFVNTLGLSGGFVGPYAFGLAESVSGDPSAGMLVLLVTGALGAALVPVLAAVLRSGPGHRNPATVAAKGE